MEITKHRTKQNFTFFSFFLRVIKNNHEPHKVICRVKPSLEEVILEIRGVRQGDSQVRHEAKFIVNQTYVYISKGIRMGRLICSRDITLRNVPHRREIA